LEQQSLVVEMEKEKQSKLWGADRIASTDH
jgi:hypothetical protein